MTTTLTKPWKVNQRAECIYAYAPGECCIDLCSGTPEDRARVMALLEQVQKMGRILKALVEDRGVNKADAEAVLRDAGVMSEGLCRGEG